MSTGLRVRGPWSARACGLLLVIWGPGVVVDAAAGELRGIVEGPPEQIVYRLQQREKELKALVPLPNGASPFSLVVELQRLWRPGQTVTVAFEDGETPLHREIEQVAGEWTKHANLKLDFGYDAATNTYRRWSRDDNEYAADIRIAFRKEPKWSGLWSALGTKSIDKELYWPEEPSMNLERLGSRSESERRNIILHEFGHALGAHHEHKNPQAPCEDELRWYDEKSYVKATDRWGQYVEDDNGRRPGIYTILGGEPNNWSASQVDNAYGRLPDTSAYDGGPFDPKSIMVYKIKAWLMKDPSTSQCIIEDWPLDLSDLDKERIGKFYPRDDTVAARVREEKAISLKSLQDYSAKLTPQDAALKAAIDSISE